MKYKEKGPSILCGNDQIEDISILRYLWI